MFTTFHSILHDGAAGGGVLASLASAHLQGDPVALLALNDYLVEFPEKSTMLSAIQKRKSYLLKTFGLFYHGEVCEHHGDCITLLPGTACLVVEVGGTAEVFGGTQFTYSEPFPRNCPVILNCIHIYAAEELQRMEEAQLEMLRAAYQRSKNNSN
jgi:hypothetical protein